MEMKSFVGNLIYKFYFYDVPKLEKFTNADENYMDEYKKLLQQFFDSYFNLYVEPYINYESLHPQTHYDMIKTLFREAHGYGGHVDTSKLNEIENVIKLLNKSLDNGNYEVRNSAMINELKSDSFSHI